MTFKQENSLEKRTKLSEKILTQYKNRIPVIVEPANERAPSLNKTKFLCPVDMTVGAFVQEIKKHLTQQQSATESIFLFVNNSVLPNNALMMAQIYEKNKDADGFLYLSFSGENVFGC
mmetsp:Transcript_22680/g.38495  ORF Transcript_22680/g.38495 Transcript_22680/m.38495 type:complete len:118 (+) Transcript_22680:108-461(+)